MHNPECYEAQELTERDPQYWQRIHISRWRNPVERHQDRINCRAPNPSLYAKPSAGNDSPGHCGHVGSHRSEACSRYDWKRHAILRAGMTIGNHWQQHNEIAKQYRQDSLPPRHARSNHASCEHIGRNTHCHTDPQGGNMPLRPRASVERNCRKIGIAQQATHPSVSGPYVSGRRSRKNCHVLRTSSIRSKSRSAITTSSLSRLASTIIFPRGSQK